MFDIKNLKKINSSVFEISKSYRDDMRVSARIFANDTIIQDILMDKSIEQIVNVATLPGIKNFAFAMPDIHQGYGFPIGGVAAMAIDEGGVISPGGIGYDINCGVRVLSSSLNLDDVKDFLEPLANQLFRDVPSGVGKGGRLEFKGDDLDEILTYGVHRLQKLGYASQDDIEFCENNGRMVNADASKVSSRAKNRGKDQLATLGSGNHFLEVQYVEEIYENNIAQILGVKKNQICVMIHCGSRGLGHQNCTDYVRLMIPKLKEWDIVLPDRELACAPFNSELGQDYFNSMAACANFAWANRQLITYFTRKAFDKVFGNNKLKLIYDVSHNIGKKEVHKINEVDTNLIVHRKGATRAFGPGHEEIPIKYKDIGQPVFIPGSMGTSSFILTGTQEAMDLSFGSCCHGAGRRLSRAVAKKTIQAIELRDKLKQMGIIVKTHSIYDLPEEAPEVYKDIDNVIDIVVNAKIAKKVAKLKPLVVIKGD